MAWSERLNLGKNSPILEKIKKIKKIFLGLTRQGQEFSIGVYSPALTSALP